MKTGYRTRRDNSKTAPTNYARQSPLPGHTRISRPWNENWKQSKTNTRRSCEKCRQKTMISGRGLPSGQVAKVVGGHRSRRMLVERTVAESEWCRRRCNKRWWWNSRRDSQGWQSKYNDIIDHCYFLPFVYLPFLALLWWEEHLMEGQWVSESIIIICWRWIMAAEKCDPVQQKGHDVGQVYSEIMSKTVCKI